MITTSKANKQAYTKLFDEASAALEFPAKDSITNLTQYFENLGSLSTYALQQAENGNTEFYKFIRLPVALTDEESESEPVLAINANTRNISVPTVFKKGVSVEGDNGAETLYFMIDRYFDAQDLAEDTKIIIQWETAPTADKRAETEKGASAAFLVDKDSYPTKLIFGWILDDRITKRAGTIKFAVRIYQTGADARTNKEIITYSFSTTNSTANILAALNYDVVNEVVPENNSSLVLNRLKNSTPSQYGDAEEPIFVIDLSDIESSTPVEQTITGEDGIETTIIEKYNYDLLNQDTVAAQANLAINLTVQAVADNVANISYEWIHKTPDGVESNAFLASTEFIKSETIGDTFDSSKVYYDIVPEEGTGKLKAGTIITSIPEENSISAYQAANSGHYVCERVSILPVSKGEDGATSITGTYQVTAYNRQGASNVSEAKSAILNIPAPTYISIGTLAADQSKTILAHDADDTSADPVNVGTTTLQIVEEDDGKVTDYMWQKYNSETEEYEDLEDGNVESYDINVAIDDLALFDERYQVKVTAYRNGDSIEETSGSFRVTDRPHKFTLNPANTATGKTYTVGKTNTLTAEISNADSIISDEVYYDWYKFNPDQDADDEVEIPDIDRYDETGEMTDKLVQSHEVLNSNELIIYDKTWDDEAKKKLSGGRYYCIVTNVVNGQKAESYSGVYVVIG